MKNTSKILLALVGGVALGAAIGILLAPDKGSETRSKLKATARKFGDKAKDKFRESMNAASDLRSKVEEEAEELI
ncbi:MAG TPA: YtxH domain-containing protein [Bacteroidia bacterium]|nr:YtxH domain-containing protein [Bacteroidia bacterium]